MELIQFIATGLGLLAAIFGMFLWTRAESRNDIRHLESKIEGKLDNLISAIQNETKDFHGRLCGLEERTKK